MVGGDGPGRWTGDGLGGVIAERGRRSRGGQSVDRCTHVQAACFT